MATNKVKVEIIMTAEQRKDFLWAINDIMNQGALTEGRAIQLLVAEYKSSKPIKNETVNPKNSSTKEVK